MAVEIEQGEVFAARRQRSVPIEPMMIHIHDALVAPVGFTAPVPSLLDWRLCRPDHASPSPARIEPLRGHRRFQPPLPIR